MMDNTISMYSEDYESLKCEVLDFFKNVNNGLDLEDCIDQFKSYLYMLCDIDIDEELKNRYNEIHLNNKNKSL